MKSLKEILSKSIPNKDLLRNKKVIEEIERHLWIESEKVGYDIGFEKAAIDWLDKFSKVWMDYHLPANKITLPKVSKGKNSLLKKKSL